jgi:EAL domain-containing protein (putative c-di-GMP-specific phosphodiesterase class I)
MDQELTRRRELEAELRGAIRGGQLQLHYQPIVDLRTGRISSFEALVRWQHPERGMLSPDEFIAIAEATGLIITMGNWIVLEACRTAMNWPADIKVSVNVSPVQMQAPGAALGFLNALKVSGLPASRLDLEITENVFAGKTEHVVEFVRLIRDAGIGLTLDDFGTGYSSLSYIREFDFSKIKIDRSFVSGLHDGDRASAIVAAVAYLAERLDMPVVAEGIETESEAARVRKLGCTHGQGYLFSRGVPASELPKLLDQPPAKRRVA